MKNDRISIIMPVKDGASFLRPCLDSILAQSTDDWEMIVVDDGSIDNSMDIVKEYSAQDSRINTLKNVGVGIADALLTGINQCNGVFVTRMDCDDLMVKNKLENLRRALQEKGTKHVSMSQVQYFSECDLGQGYLQYEGWLNEVLEQNTVYENIYKECTIPSPSWMAYRQDLKTYDLMLDLGLPEDYELAFRFYQHKFKTVPVLEKLHLWRDHEDRISRKGKDYDIRSFGLFKLKKFLQLEKFDNLVLWGSGKKGKVLAKYLNEKGVNFHWITDNEKKWGHAIHGTALKSSQILKDLKQPSILIAVSNKEEQAEIKRDLEILKKDRGLEYFFFF